MWLVITNKKGKAEKFMENGIILLIVVIVLILGVKGSIKHFQGQGGCCGGGSKPEKVKKKVLKNPRMGKKVIEIEGMHCAHCKQSVTSALNQLDGVVAKVNLARKCAVVSYDREVSDSVLKKAVEDAGFQVVSIH